MFNINKFDESLNLTGKRILLRIDLNVPMQNGAITEESRIKKILPTLNLLIKKKAKIIIISHLGRPKGKITSKLSLKPVAEKLSTYINQNVFFLNESIGAKVIEKSKTINNGSVLMLENIRFYKDEELNSLTFSKELSKIGDIFINEAFSCSHRAHASVCGITNYIKSYAGKELFEEINSIKMLTENSKKPVTCIIGGAKISTKIGIIKNLIKKTQNIIIVGAMANNFIKYNGFEIGRSLFEKNQEKLVKNIINESESSNCKLIIPEDVTVARNEESSIQIKNLKNVNKEDKILDIGKKTVEKILAIIDNSNTVLWNGPAGYFEVKEFSLGTIEIAKKISKNTHKKNLISIIGGGDTVAAINKFHFTNTFTYTSTAGGAFLELLEGKDLPGIKALEKK